MSFKISFTDLHHSDLLIECRHISTSTKQDFNVLSTILSLQDFFLFAVLSVTKKSFNYLNLALRICYGRKNKKIKRINVVKFSFSDRNNFTLKTSNDFQKPMKFACFIPLTHVRQISEPVQLFDLKSFPFPPISIEFSVRTVSYGSLFFPLDL